MTQKYSRYDTCLGKDLSWMTQSGWELVDVRDEETQEPGLPYMTQEVINGYQQSVSKQGPPVLVKRPVFVLGMGRDTELEQLRHDARSAKDNFDDAALIRDKALAERAAAEKERDALKKELDAKTAMIGATERRYQELQTVNYRLEADIAKLRREIGEARYREILGPKENP